MNKMMALWVMLFLTATAALAQSERRIYTSSELESMQTGKDEAKMTKEQKKLLEAMQDSIDHACAVKALETLDFVLEADQLVLKSGRTVFVSAGINFVSLSDDKAVVQIAPFNDGRGPNGVGGITLEGRASNIHIKTDKNGDITFTMSVSGTGLSSTVSIYLRRESNRASVTVNPNFHSNRVTLNGILLPTARANVYKGRAL